MTTCEEFLLIAGFSCIDDWWVEFAPSFLENGRARCAELRVAGPLERTATTAVL